MKANGDRHLGTPDTAFRLAKMNTYTWASDLSNYDDSVSAETLDAYRELLLEPMYAALVGRGVITATEAALMVEIDEYINTAPMLAPPVYADTGAELLPTLGAIKSGERLTSVKGTDLNDIRTAAKAAELGIDVEWTNFGDDLLLASDDASAQERWFDTDQVSYGFEEKEAEDASFLMRRVPEGYAYFNRMLFRSVNREVHEEPDTYSVAALGLKTRYELLSGHPAQGMFWQALAVIGGRVATAARIAENTSLLELLTLVAAELSTRPATAGLSREEFERLEQIAGEAAVAQVTSPFRGSVIQKSGMRFDDFMAAVRSTPESSADRAIRRKAA
jgi:hypothetical protein